MHGRRTVLSAAWAVLAAGIAIGCGAAIRTSDEPVTDQPPGRIADHRRPYDAPPHRFTPRAVASRPPRPAPPAPGFSSLPALRLNMGCYGVVDKQPAQVAIGRSEVSGAGAGAGYGARRKAAPSKPTGARVTERPAPAPPPAAAAPSAPPRDSKKIEAAPPPPSAAPAAPMESAMPSSERWAEEPAAHRERERREDRPRIAADDDMAAEPPVEDFDDRFDDWGQAIYLSNDDSMSLSSAQRVMYAIDHFLPLPPEHIRPHELLNYFSFETLEVAPDRDFSVLADVAEDPREEGIHTLGLSVRGRQVTRAGRRNAHLTWVIDRSGSMWDEGRMDYLKRGLRRSLDELKDGDLLHLVLFDHEVCVPVEGFVVGRDDRAGLERAIDLLRPKGATDIHRGLDRGYQLADRHYQAEYENRVILVTDALANVGVVDNRSIAMISKYYDQRRIRLSGVGVGREFNDELLDRLTERGKGAYVFLGSEAEVDAMFGPRFISLIETVALDVHFRLHLPPSMRMNVFYGEESSTVKEDVQAIHYFAGTSQLFLADLMARGGELRPQDDVMLTIEYQDPDSGDKLFDEMVFNLGQIGGEAFNVLKGRLIMAWIDMLAAMAARPMPAVYRAAEGMWEDADGYRLCQDGAVELERLAEPLGERAADPEIRRVFELWDRYCSRYERPRSPVRRKVMPPEGWPGGQPTVEPR